MIHHLFSTPFRCFVMAVLLTLAALSPLFCAELPVDAQKAIERAEGDIAKAKQAVLVVLTKAHTKAEKEGKTDVAAALQEKIDLYAPDNLLTPGPITDLDTLIAGVKNGTLTQDQWNALKLPEFVCDSNGGRNDFKTALRAGQKALVIPAPDDRWQGEVGNPKVGYAGEKSGNGYARASMLITAGDDDAKAHPVTENPTVEGPGKVYGWMHCPGAPKHIGSLRVKILVIK